MIVHRTKYLELPQILSQLRRIHAEALEVVRARAPKDLRGELGLIWNALTAPPHNPNTPGASRDRRSLSTEIPRGLGKPGDRSQHTGQALREREGFLQLFLVEAELVRRREGILQLRSNLVSAGQTRCLVSWTEWLPAPSCLFPLLALHPSSRWQWRCYRWLSPLWSGFGRICGLRIIRLCGLPVESGRPCFVVSTFMTCNRDGVRAPGERIALVAAWIACGSVRKSGEAGWQAASFFLVPPRRSSRRSSRNPMRRRSTGIAATGRSARLMRG